MFAKSKKKSTRKKKGGFRKIVTLVETVCTNENCRRDNSYDEDCNDTYVDDENQKWHRVFGEWKCTLCKNKWKSGYTWIQLEKYVDNILDLELDETQDYLQQKCKSNKCKNAVYGSRLVGWRDL